MASVFRWCVCPGRSPTDRRRGPSGAGPKDLEPAPRPHRSIAPLANGCPHERGDELLDCVTGVRLIAHERRQRTGMTAEQKAFRRALDVELRPERGQCGGG